MTNDKADLIDLLTRDHHDLEYLFAELTAAQGLAERRRILDDIALGLVRHAVIGEMHLYPAVRRHLPDGDRIADEYVSGNAEVERLLEELRRTATVDHVFAELTRRLMDEVHEHLREEQHALLPRLAEHASPEDLRRLSETVESVINRASVRSRRAAPARGEPDLIPRVRQRVPHESGHEAWPRRPRTPKDPDSSDQAGLRPSLRARPE